MTPAIDTGSRVVLEEAGNVMTGRVERIVTAHSHKWGWSPRAVVAFDNGSERHVPTYMLDLEGEPAAELDDLPF